MLAVFVGFEVVSKVSTTLHTPLMSGANAIHGMILVGAILVTGQRRRRRSSSSLGLVAVVLATVNMVGGFVVTDRMLEMFKGRKRTDERGADAGGRAMTDDLGRRSPTSSRRSASSSRSRACRRPKTARNGNLIGAFGAVLAVRHDARRPTTSTTCR